MNTINFYNKIYSNLILYKSAKLLTNDEELFLERLNKLKTDVPGINYEDDILIIQNKYTSFNEFNTEYNSTIRNIVELLNNNCESLIEKYLELKDTTLYIQYNGTNIEAGHKYISIDLKFGAFQTLLHNDILKNYTSWDEVFSACSDNPLFKDSKQFKIDTIKKFYKSNKLNIHPLMLHTLNCLFTGDNIIANTFKDITPSLFLADEVVFDITDDFNKYDDLLGDKTIDGIDIHVRKFSYDEIGWFATDLKDILSIFPIRDYGEGNVYMAYKSSPLFWLLYNNYHQIEDTENDYKYQFNEYLITTVEKKPDFIVGDELKELKKIKKKI